MVGEPSSETPSGPGTVSSSGHSPRDDHVPIAITEAETRSDLTVEVRDDRLGSRCIGSSGLLDNFESPGQANDLKSFGNAEKRSSVSNLDRSSLLIVPRSIRVRSAISVRLNPCRSRSRSRPAKAAINSGSPTGGYSCR